MVAELPEPPPATEKRKTQMEKALEIVKAVIKLETLQEMVDEAAENAAEEWQKKVIWPEQAMVLTWVKG